MRLVFTAAARELFLCKASPDDIVTFLVLTLQHFTGSKFVVKMFSKTATGVGRHEEENTNLFC